jgi:hypothetical protein
MKERCLFSLSFWRSRLFDQGYLLTTLPQGEWSWREHVRKSKGDIKNQESRNLGEVGLLLV